MCILSVDILDIRIAGQINLFLPDNCQLSQQISLYDLVQISILFCCSFGWKTL